ncbi:hypothetical protein KC19_VG158400 [Ceratodon purpureus]|uniref:Uncharacterized protein n=1 Tax=Ceratodon purpureus TaxID=3225 RepID=A0A8T0HQZ0_CERPU|nr:hypothetical protein KC19_VG158400 [Ceratodon purpureus]
MNKYKRLRQAKIARNNSTFSRLLTLLMHFSDLSLANLLQVRKRRGYNEVGMWKVEERNGEVRD